MLSLRGGYRATAYPTGRPQQAGRQQGSLLLRPRTAHRSNHHGGGGISGFFGHALHEAEHSVGHTFRRAEHGVVRATSGVAHLTARTASSLYHDELRGLREELKYGKLAGREVYKHSDDVAAGLTIAGLIAGGILAPEAVLPALLFGGADLFSLAGAAKAVSGRHKNWTAFTLDVSSVGFSRLAERGVRGVEALDRLSGSARSEYHGLSEVLMRDPRPTTSAALRHDIDLAIGEHRAARISSERIRQAVLVERLVSAMLANQAAAQEGWRR